MTSVSISSPSFPSLLKKIHDPPNVLHVKGALSDPSSPHVAIVGSRRPSDAGRAMTRKIASGLAYAGCTIVSGLAYGIDAEAHEGALSVGGATVAVLGSGVDRPAPVCNLELAERIASSGNGCLVSEYPSGTPAMKHHFVARNRIVAGMCALTIVIEGAEKSGTRITVEFALSEGRDVGAVPGTPLNPMSATPNAFLKEGAAMITSANDALELLNWERIPNIDPRDDTHPILEALLAHGPLEPNEMAERIGTPVRTLMETITNMEIAGTLKRNERGLLEPA